MKLAMWIVQGTQGTLSPQRYANILHQVREYHIDLCDVYEYDLGFPPPEATTNALQNNFKCYAAPGTELRVALFAKFDLSPTY